MPKSAAEEAPDQTVVYLGNRNAIEILPDPDDPENPERRTRTPIKTPKKSITEITPPTGLRLLEIATLITDPHRGVWQAHSDDDAPAWVASTDPALASVLSEHWGGIEIREPDHELARAALQGHVPASAGEETEA